MINEPLTLAVDIGTSSVRAMAFDLRGGIRAREQISYPVMRPRPYFEEQDPLLVRSSTYKAIAQLLSSGSVDPGRIACISFSSQMYSIMALDEEGKPLTNSLPWSDGRAETQAETMKKTKGAMWLYPRTGCPMNSIYPIAKIRWLREETPEVFGKTARFACVKEFVTNPLIGEWVVDYSMASASGMFDVAGHIWDQEALIAAGIGEFQLSEPVSGTKAFRLVPDSPLAGLGLPKDTLVFLGAGDGPLANLGSGAFEVGAINIDLGTSGAARCTSDAPITDEDASLWCFCLDDSHWAYGGIVTNVGNSYQWLASAIAEISQLSGEEAFELLNERAAAVAPGSEGLLFMPYLRKARSPYWDGRLRGTMYGLTADHGFGHMARALLEAIAYDLKTIIGLMDRRIATIPHILLTGGLSRSPLIPQLLADVLGREIRIPEQNEGSIAGAAILGFSGLGKLDGLRFEQASPHFASVRPDPERKRQYEDFYGNYRRLVETFRNADLS